MITVSVFPLECAWQGGLRMSSRPSSPEGQVTPAQVWSALSLDLRTRVIGLLAQISLEYGGDSSWKRVRRKGGLPC